MPDIRETPMEITAAKDLLIQEIRVMREHWKLLQDEAKYLNEFALRIDTIEDKQKIDRELANCIEREVGELRKDMNAELLDIDTDIELQRQTTLNNIEKSKVSIPWLWLLSIINLACIIFLYFKR
jgi:phosphoglycerate-specific signal transduction histidine kinase